MSAVNTHGIKINGLRKVCGETKNLRGYYDGLYLEIFYDVSDGYLWTTEHASHNNWTKYEDSEIVKIANAYDHMTMQEIADAVYERVGKMIAGK